MASARELDASLRTAGERLKGLSCVVALSGGADSAALGWLASQFGASARAVHVDHGQKASSQLRLAAEKVCANLGLSLSIVEVMVPNGPSFEHQARLVRYEALYEQLRPGDSLLTGHTSDDNAETVVLNLSRGAGATGLAGIPAEGDRLLRPLLDVSRAVVRDLAMMLDLGAEEDPTNADLRYERNRIRHEVLPLLGSSAAIARAARLSAVDDQLLESQARAVPIRLSRGRAFVPIAPLLTMPEAVSSRVIRRALRSVNPPYPGTSRMVEAVLAVARGSQPRVELGDGVDAYRSEASVVLDAGRDIPPAATPLVMPITRYGPWRFSAAWCDRPPETYPLGSSMAVLADPPELTIRPGRPGDRLALRSGGHKPLVDVFAEAQIAQPLRESWPVLAAEEHVWWVPGVRRAWLGWGDSSSGRYVVVNILMEGA